MDRLSKRKFGIVCHGKVVRIPLEGDEILQVIHGERTKESVKPKNTRYKVIMRIIDQSGSTPIVIFNTMINKFSGYTAWELMKKHGMDVDEYWPRELLDLVGKRCDAVNDEPAFVKHFKEGFLDKEDDDEGFTTPASRIKVTNLGDNSVNRVLDMQTPTSGNEASRSGESSGSKRVFIDLDDIDSDEDEEGKANKTPKLLIVKVEKEDP
ncbi:hypothetical protein Tco_1234886 [Tanacetum coccineum]